jgi:hypothetical protein
MASLCEKKKLMNNWVTWKFRNLLNIWKTPSSRTDCAPFRNVKKHKAATLERAIIVAATHVTTEMLDVALSHEFHIPDLYNADSKGAPVYNVLFQSHYIVT